MKKCLKNPVWVDKTGNGHDLQMKNFLWGGMSGVISAKLIQFADKFTIVGDWKFMEDRNDKAGSKSNLHL